MRKALFIDRDGTINHDKGYTYRIEDLIIYEDIVPFIKRYNDANYLVVVIANQSGIGRGYYKKEDADAFNKELAKRLEEQGAHIDAFYYCPHRPEENCSCRKPKTGLVEKAAKELSIDVKGSLVAGDKSDVDGELAKRLGIEFIKIEHE
ncbi:MAG: HAD family hydrolase [Candidatus Micrarchaeaceae archaeon]